MDGIRSRAICILSSFVSVDLPEAYANGSVLIKLVVLKRREDSSYQVF